MTIKTAIPDKKHNQIPVMNEFCTYIIDNSNDEVFKQEIFEFIRYDLQRKIVAEAKIEIQVQQNFYLRKRPKFFTSLFVKFLFTSIKQPDGKGMIWKSCPHGDELKDRLYLDHLPTIENFYNKAHPINGFDLQKALTKAFSLLRKVFKFLKQIQSAIQTMSILKPFEEKNQLPKKAQGL